MKVIQCHNYTEWPRNSENILVKSISLYLERFQRYGVLKNYNFMGHHDNHANSTSLVYAYVA